MPILFFILTTLFATKSSVPGEISIAVSTKKNIMELRVSGKTIHRYDVSVGTKKHPTPPGTYLVNHIVWNPSWVPPDEKWAKGKKPAAPGSDKNPMKVVKIFFKEPDFYLHGTGDEEFLGEAASHGCIRMSQRDAFNLGRYLMDHGGVPKSADWYNGVFTRGVSADIRLPRSAKMIIGR
jgi:lipoprotein-anchoring transpeptidase ErfK/SrfK